MCSLSSLSHSSARCTLHVTYPRCGLDPGATLPNHRGQPSLFESSCGRRSSLLLALRSASQAAPVVGRLTLRCAPSSMVLAARIDVIYYRNRDPRNIMLPLTKNSFVLKQASYRWAYHLRASSWTVHILTITIAAIIRLQSPRAVLAHCTGLSFGRYCQERTSKATET